MRYCEIKKDRLFAQLKVIIGNGGKIHHIVNDDNGKVLIIYS